MNDSKNIRDIRRMVQELGFVLVGIEHTNKAHLRIRVSNGQQERFVIQGSTPSDVRAMRNLRRIIARVFDTPLRHKEHGT